MKLKLAETLFIALSTALVSVCCIIGLGLTAKVLWLLLKFGWSTI